MLRAITAVVLPALLCAGCAAAAAAPSSTEHALPSSTPALTAAPTASPEGSGAAETSQAPASVVDVRCGAGAPALGADRVRTSPDGIHLHVTGEPGWELGVSGVTGNDSLLLGAADQELVMAVAPGDVTVECAEPASPNPSTSPLRIEDPDGWYRSKAAGDGTGTCVGNNVDYANGARGAPADPVRQARAMLRGLQAGDIVERAGYATDTGSVRVVRGGNVVATLAFEDDGAGGWLYSGSTICGDLGIR